MFKEAISTSKGVVNTKQRRLEENEDQDLPSSYLSNSNKEELCLEFVANFYSQFKRLFPERKPLFICPENERGITKFVSTTVRSSLLPYRDLYDVERCSTFVANIIEYEPLESPNELPKCLPSPTSTLAWRAGDCFDMSNLLVSFLVGSGYDAYIVSGYAPKAICLLDQTKEEYPQLEQETPRNVSSQAKYDERKQDDEMFEPQSRQVVTSRYVEMQEEKERERMEQLNQDEEIEYEEEEEEDEYEGQRIHAWVLVRAGKREVQDHMFVEPSTGKIYSIKDSPYLGIESAWNNQNYYVNMQTERRAQDTEFDFTSSTEWEYVFIDTKRGHSNQESTADETDATEQTLEALESDDEAENKSEMDILDLPKSWVDKIVLSHDIYQKKYYNMKENCTLFKKAKLEQYAENVQYQGIVSRLTIYRDRDRTIPIECREYFKNRKDKLDYRIRYPLEGKVHEHFLSGRPGDALKDRIEWLGRRRELQFYTSARADGLERKVEALRQKCVYHYADRDDLLIYRSVTLSQDKEQFTAKNTYTIPNGSQGELLILKMAEKFQRGRTLSEAQVPQKRTFLAREGTIRVKYHYTPGNISASSRIYSRTPNTPVEIIDADPTARRPKDSILEKEQQRMLQLEKECYSAVRHSEMETQELLKLRKREEGNIILEANIFDMARANASDEKFRDRTSDNEKETAASVSDYLTPFLQHVVDLDKITREEAHRARDQCLKALKDRLLERANIIQARLDDENAQLAKKQAAFQRSQREHDQGTDEEFEKYCSDAMFRISILEQRLTRHEEAALQKYSDLDQRLHRDPRLAGSYR